ncbi:MAG: macro domain-containing protein [Candidatus Kariarchaeaceae archaeon]|jgi:O-acetyl-ADP-ribose deacetylase (regulator of RNase III)
MEFVVNNRKISLIKGDITKQTVDVIVNAANNHLKHGGGVARAIASAAGVKLEDESRKIDFIPTGECVATTAGNLNANAVIHAVGPVWKGGESGETEQLTSCIHNSLSLADEMGFQSIAYPAISTGIYGYPIQLAARSILSTTKQFLEREGVSIVDVRFVLFSEDDFNTFKDHLQLMS